VPVRYCVAEDVREATEREATGAVKGAVHAPRGLLELHADADPESTLHLKAFSSGKRLVVYCGSGGRSALAAKTLKDMGIEKVASLAGGFPAWQQAGGPTER
jgi:rhodanese-related sulfurtransferase